MASPVLLSRREDYGLDLVDGAVVLGPDRLASLTALAIYVTFSAGALGGAVAVETAPSVGHSGPWHPVAMVEWIAKGRTHYVAVQGVHLALRIRVVKPIVQGVVTIHALGS